MENARNFVFGNFGLKILDLKIISSHTHAFLFLNFNALSYIILFFKNCVFPQKYGKPLPNSIGPICFSTNRNFLNLREGVSVCFDRSKLVNQVFKKTELNFFKVTFQIVFNFSLSALSFTRCPMQQETQSKVQTSSTLPCLKRLARKWATELPIHLT